MDSDDSFNSIDFIALIPLLTLGCEIYRYPLQAIKPQVTAKYVPDCLVLMLHFSLSFHHKIGRVSIILYFDDGILVLS